MTFNDESSFFYRHIRPQWNDKLAQQWRRLPRTQAVSIGRLLANHHNLRGHFFRLAAKKDPQTEADADHMCRFCNLAVETAAHLILDCSNLQVMSTRSNSSISDYFNPLQSDDENVANMLLSPEAWPLLCQFFISLEISV
jgi:hypothetical protein